mmetsp:Transcript_40306/g.95376  ORF Transcript_40306/g.95376 Transcript_40306/m.95376 type:complete len:575 (-) Transcript_40306:194-1918(-)
MVSRRTLALVAGVAAVVLACVVLGGNDSSKARSMLAEEKAHSRGRHHVHRTAAQRTVMQEEQEAKLQEKRMVATEPVSAKTEDDYIAARTHLASLRREVADDTERRATLEVEEKARLNQVDDAKAARKAAAMRVSLSANTLVSANHLAATARASKTAARTERSTSEKREAQGIALQQPAAALLRDSQKLNDQSNLVLDQSHSAQAKALAALDLKLAQSLAGRASKGMAKAKGFFAEAITDRKAAVEDDQEAAQTTIEAAQVSLKQNKEMPALMHVLHGQQTGGKAASAVVDADSKALDNAEKAFGAEKAHFASAVSEESKVAKEIFALSERSGIIRKEVHAAQAFVVDAAKAHLRAAQAYKDATQASVRAQTSADHLRQHEVKELEKKLADARDAKEEASTKYTGALESVSKLSGHQTVLQVQVARLRLQLKEAKMQRDDSKSKAGREQETINTMQAELDKEDSDLNEARLRLADQHMGLMSKHGGDGDHAHDGGRQNEAHDLASRAMADVAKQGDSEDSRDALDRQRRRDVRLRQAEADAHHRAQSEESKLRAAQKEVQRQMEKVTGLESSMQ